MKSEAELQQLLRENIPISEKMGVRVAGLSPQSLCLSAPLQPNINHKSTAFGGSLFNLLVLAGWGLIAARLSESATGAEIVIQESHIRYLKPVQNDFVACAEIHDETVFQRFEKQLLRRNKARIEMNARVIEDQQTAVEFNGRYVVLLNPRAQ